MIKLFKTSLLGLLLCATQVKSQQPLVEEQLWSFIQLGAPVVSPDQNKLVYSVRSTDLDANKGNSDLVVYDFSTKKENRITQSPESESAYSWRPDGEWVGYLSGVSGSTQLWEIRSDGSTKRQVSNIEGGINGYKYSPDGKMIFYIKNVKLDESLQDKYPALSKSTGKLIEGLMYRHWDSWHDGTYNHLFLQTYEDGKLTGKATDILEGEKVHSPLPPFGGSSEINFSPDSKSLVYVSKKLQGTAAATSTNSGLYLYDIQAKTTKLLTTENLGYDNEPQFSSDGSKLAWLSMARDGYEADKNQILVMNMANGLVNTITTSFDQSVSSLQWGLTSDRLFFTAYTQGTVQLYEYLFDLNAASKAYGSTSKKLAKGTATFVVTEGLYNYSAYSYIDKGKNGAIVMLRQSMSSPNELVLLDLATKKTNPLSQPNQALLGSIRFGKVESRNINASDGKSIQTWVIYPPDFDPKKKYPTLLYCQGGPQSMIGQSWSNRWNFQLMAAKGYIVVAPNRRGLPGFGQAWNEQISGDWGGQAMRDYLAAIDTLAKEPFVDENNLGAVGASFGGYSVYWLAGNHQKRFKAFIAHCGVYNLEAMYGQTEEVFFTDFEMKGKPWDIPRPASYDRDSPHRYVKNWDTPILVIHNEKDFRVPLAQGMEAFTAAQVQGIPSKFLYFPDENHWVLKPQNNVLWNKVFFDWLDTYLNP